MRSVLLLLLLPANGNGNMAPVLNGKSSYADSCAMSVKARRIRLVFLECALSRRWWNNVVLGPLS
ncbi:hypothetical protein O6H91_Y569200 [Diphasiastrum complanatum]|nr:hypothetical protein O6H91_Y569200 [Diphasiastrum complanatum]